MHGGELAVSREAIDSPFWCVASVAESGEEWGLLQRENWLRFANLSLPIPAFDGRFPKVTLNNWLRSVKPKQYALCTDQ